MDKTAEQQESYIVRDGHILCPECRQPLTQADVESFHRCPFCDHLFPEDLRFEDYLLQPAVDLFIRAAGQEFFARSPLPFQDWRNQ